MTGKYAGGSIPTQSRLDRKDKRFLEAEWRNESVEVAENLRPLALDLGCTVGQLATAWAMANRYVHSVIIGPKNLEQAQESIGAALVNINAEVDSFIDDLIPPGCHSGKGFFDQNYAPVLGRSIT